MKTAIVGATGLVGRTFIKVLEKRNFPVGQLIPVASQRSMGKTILMNGKEHRLTDLAGALALKPDIAFFSAGSSVSREWAPKFAAAGTVVIDNSSAWRLASDIPLVVPEVNGNTISASDRLIANPNCSTIQLLVATHALHRAYQIQRMVISTYQSVSGSGQSAIDQMEGERKSQPVERAYPHPIYMNCLPHCGDFDEDGYTEEEKKLSRETAKILDPAIKVTATAVRVPVTGGHSESVNLRFARDFEMSEVRNLLRDSPGVKVLDSPAENLYPMPLDAFGKDEVFVGRLRRDNSEPNSLNMWIVADNLRKGAATNAIQIAEYCIERGFVQIR